MKIDQAVVLEHVDTPSAYYSTAGVILQWNPVTNSAYMGWWEWDAAKNKPKQEFGFIPAGAFSFPCIMPGGQAETGGYWCPDTDPRNWRVGTDLTDLGAGSMSVIVDGDIKVAPLAIPSNPDLFFFPPPDRGLNDTTAVALKAYWDSLVP